MESSHAKNKFKIRISYNLNNCHKTNRIHLHEPHKKSNKNIVLTTKRENGDKMFTNLFMTLNFSENIL